MKINVGIIGAGKMGSAIAYGIADSYDVLISNRSYNKLEKFRDSKIMTRSSNTELVKESDIIIIAVKPDKLKEVLEEISKEITKDKIIISAVAGKTNSDITEFFASLKYVKVMPTIAAEVKESMTAICFNDNCDEKTKELVLDIFSKIGETSIIAAELFDVYTGAISTLGAYVYVFIEAAADAAVANGLNRADSYAYIAQMVKSSAILMQEKKQHPAELKDAICSPKGITIRGVCELEENGFRNAVIQAVNSAVKKSIL